MREYIVQVSDPAVWDTLHDEIINRGSLSAYVPDRPVLCMNDRPFNDYLAHYELTDKEASLLQNDPRVLEVELQADLREGVKKGFVATRPEYHYDSRTSVTTATMKNWGLLRCHNIVSNFLTTGNEYVASLNYQLDGTGVDIIVVDSGVAEGHPEFAVNADGTGGSRVVDFDWASLGVSGCPTASSVNGYLGDVGGHGSHCAGISAGNTCGWASGAKIYSIRCDFGEGSTDITDGSTKGFISTDIAFDLVRAFHLAKKAAGNKRPTICTNSWGYRGGVTNFNYLIWRGVTYYGTSNWQNVGMSAPFEYSQISYLNQSADNCSAAGVILVGAAGNSGAKMDVLGGLDYDNRWYDTSGNGPYYWHRGSSPTMASSFINVGAIHNDIYTPDGKEHKASYSNTGPRIDIWAPGTSIMSAYANTSYNTPAVYDPRGGGKYFLNKISGTSMACPQVTGYLACILQARPDMTTAEAKKFLLDWGYRNTLSPGYTGGTDYPDFGNYNRTYRLQGATDAILGMPFNKAVRAEITKKP